MLRSRRDQRQTMAASIRASVSGAVTMASWPVASPARPGWQTGAPSGSGVAPSEHQEGDHHCNDGEGQGDAEHPTDDAGGLTLPGLGRSLDIRLSVGHPQSQRNGKCKVWLSPHKERRPMAMEHYRILHAAINRMRGS